MDFKLSPAQADPHHQGEVVVLAPKDWTDAEEALSRLAHVASDRRRGPAASDFSAGPRLTEPSLDAAPGGADPNIDPLPLDRLSLGRRASRRVARFVLAACVGVAATLGWQSYGGTAKRMIASSTPQLSWLLLPATNAPSGRESALEQPSPAAIQASAPPAAPAQSAAVESNASEAAVSTAPTNPSLDVRQLETLSHDLAAVRESVERLAAGQEQIARDIAKLQTEKQDVRRRISAPPPAATTARKPFPPPQPALQTSAGPPTAPAQPAPQSAAPPLAPAPPPPGPALSAPLPPPPDLLLRPPMPVR